MPEKRVDITSLVIILFDDNLSDANLGINSLGIILCDDNLSDANLGITTPGIILCDANPTDAKPARPPRTETESPRGYCPTAANGQSRTQAWLEAMQTSRTFGQSRRGALTCSALVVKTLRLQHSG